MFLNYMIIRILLMVAFPGCWQIELGHSDPLQNLIEAHFASRETYQVGEDKCVLFMTFTLCTRFIDVINVNVVLLLYLQIRVISFPNVHAGKLSRGATHQILVLNTCVTRGYRDFPTPGKTPPKQEFCTIFVVKDTP